MWQKNNIRTSKSGKILFDDFYDNVLKFNSKDYYLDMIDDDDKYIINNKIYVAIDAILLFLYTINKQNIITFCYQYVDKIISNNNNFFVSSEKVLRYYDNFITYFIVDEIKWYRASDIGIALNYKNYRDGYRKHVSNKNRMPYIDFRMFSLNNKYLLKHKKYIDSQTFFISHNGMIELLMKSDMVNAIDMAKHFDIDVHQRFARKEIEIVRELDFFCKSAGIKSKHGYIVYDKSRKYVIDYYFIDYNLVIEIDEFDHVDRDPIYEKCREQFIKKHLKCKIIRCNPDDSNFNVSGLIGCIHKAIAEKI